MNLPGPHQRQTFSQGQKGGYLTVAFGSRPTFRPMGHALERIASNSLCTRPRLVSGWRAAVWDEVCSTTDGVLLRTIKILITDGPQSEPEEDT